ncbi:hypothetical protein [Lentzea albidocapillata]|uniref:hypothetical protein n=1 Tax=Lentzea albidocapillata TaxID=40571 RepID=UPI001183E009|nr:hypothetical protein [Lentzea albidocapillata]
MIAAEAARGGPSRNPGSIAYALRALRRIGAVEFVARDHPQSNDRWRLEPAAKDAVREFLKENQRDEQPAVTPLHINDRYHAILSILCGAPATSFTVRELTNKIPGGNETTVRKHVMQLYEAGYVLRKLPDGRDPGIPRYLFQLNSAAEKYARAQIDWRAAAAL